jgi:hypothetical protein
MESFRRICKILILPIFSEVRQSRVRNSEQKATLLLFLHMISGLFVMIGIYAADQATSEDAIIKNWVVVMVVITAGLFSLVILIIAGCRNTLPTHRAPETKMSDPSLKVRIGFLWLFGIVVMVHVSINFAIYIECVQSYSLANVHMTFSITSNMILSSFIICQIGFISFYQNASFSRSHLLNFACIFILAANVVIWYNGVVSNIYMFQMAGNNTIQQYGNESYCFTTSKIQQGLSRKITPYLFPFRMEFCI